MEEMHTDVNELRVNHGVLIADSRTMCGCLHVHVYEMCQAVLSCGVVYCTIFAACIPRTEVASILMAANYFIMAVCTIW